MKLAILFWFYKDFAVCENRLQIIKKYNPKSKVYGLYGGPKDNASLAESLLGPYLDDFYEDPVEDGFTKRIHGDLSLVNRYNQRGMNMEWDSIVMHQWDLLAFNSFEDIFQNLKQDNIYLSNYGIITPEFEQERDRTSKKIYDATQDDEVIKPHMRCNYLLFKELIKEKYGFEKPLPYCIFMFAVLSRKFLSLYSKVEQKEVGFLEYKIPTYAELFGIKIFELDFGEGEGKPIEDSPMNAYPIEIKKEYIIAELNKKDGRRVFHPYYTDWKTNAN